MRMLLRTSILLLASSASLVADAQEIRGSGPSSVGDEDVHATTSNDSTSHDSASHDSASHDSTSHDSASHDSASHDSTSHDSTSHDSTSHDSASHDSASHDSASHDSTSNDSTSNTTTPGTTDDSVASPSRRKGVRFVLPIARMGFGAAFGLDEAAGARGLAFDLTAGSVIAYHGASRANHPTLVLELGYSRRGQDFDTRSFVLTLGGGWLAGKYFSVALTESLFVGPDTGGARTALRLGTYLGVFQIEVAHQLDARRDDARHALSVSLLVDGSAIFVLARALDD